MEILSTIRNAATVSISEDELSAIANCLNEACNGIDLFEFSTRVGAEKEQVMDLHRILIKCLKELNPGP